jgi:DNA helicase II / ATP-dependent DNA helicase PcrA
VTAAVRRPPLLPRPLAEEINSLNPAQRRAVLAESNTVVVAGPGAGKTRLLVAKAAYLTSTEIHAPQRVACVTFGIKAAEEIRRRLRAVYSGAGQSVTCATVHAFCLAEILTPFASIAGHPPTAAQSVLDTAGQFDLRVHAYDQAGLSENPRWTEYRDMACRRALFAGEPVTGFGNQVVAAAQAYDRLLADAGKLDFEAMVGRSLQILHDRPTIRRIVAARFSWFLIDEYQDLDPVLHGIVTTLRDAGVRIFAVGDPDQSIHGFTGSDPRHLIELSQDPQFYVERLQINYRAGHVLVDAAARVLGEDRGYQPRDRSEAGILDHQLVLGGIPKHAQRTVHIATDLIAAGVAPHDIAVLYPRNRKKAPLRDWLVDAFDAANLPVATERAQPWPRGRIVAFLQKIANWQLGRQPSRAHPAAARFDELADDYAALRTLSWHHVNERLAARVDLWQAVAPAVAPTKTSQPGSPDSTRHSTSRPCFCGARTPKRQRPCANYAAHAGPRPPSSSSPVTSKPSAKSS